jgi:putative FmdB family regulatory protein
LPIFEYICNSCGNEFEELVFGGDDDVACPECEASDVGRKVSTFAFKSGSKFVSTGSSSCQGCTPGPSGCKGCSGH